jgi:4-hydroxybenzoate polyprenyltransferase
MTSVESRRAAAIARPTQISPLRTVLLSLEEARPTVLVIFLLRFTAAAVLSADDVELKALGTTAVTAAVWELGVFAVYLFNGVTDVRADRINGSARPIASGRLPVRTAAAVTAGAAALALAGAFALGPGQGAAMAALLVIGHQYSAAPGRLKNHPVRTSLTVTVMGLLTYYAGYTSPVGDAGPGHLLPMLAVAMSLWMGLVGAPAKDLPDVAGDVAAGRRPVSATLGDRAAARILAASALGLALAFCSAALAYAPPLRLAAVVMLGGAAAVAVTALASRPGDDHLARRRPYRMFMLTQYAVHLAVLAVTVAHAVPHAQ